MLEKWGKSPQGFCPRVPKRVFLLSMQRGLSATYPAPISTIFEATRESFSVCVHRWKIFQFLRRGFSGSLKWPKIWYSSVGCLCVCRANVWRHRQLPRGFHHPGVHCPHSTVTDDSHHHHRTTHEETDQDQQHWCMHCCPITACRHKMLTNQHCVIDVCYI